MQNLPFLNLPGPEFLNFFGAVVIAVLLATFVAIRLADRTGKTPPPKVPQNPEAIEVAYLQGGVNQVIRTIVYDLAQRGFVRLAKEDRVEPTKKHPQPGELNAMEKRVLESIQAKPKAHELFANLTQRRVLDEHLAPTRYKLDAQELLQPESVRVWKRRMMIAGALVIAGLAGAKLYVAYVAGRSNVAYLIFLSIAALAGLYALGYVTTRSVASRRGRAYLDAMRLAYKDRLDERLLEVGAPAGVKAFEGASLFLIGLYGFSVLKGTSEAIFADSFKRSAGDSGGCGSSCGSSCGSGDGGGGCGGCGGGD